MTAFCQSVDGLPRVTIIGAGIGGLTAGYALQAAGAQVTILERQPLIGGKARNHTTGGLAAPGGPTVLTMREIFDQLFAAGGESLSEHVSLEPLEVLAHHRWSASESLDLYHDVDRSAEAISEFAGRAEADGYRRFVAAASRIFRTVEKPFLLSPKPDLFGLARSTGPLGATHIKPFDPMWRAIGHHFKDPRLRQLFARYATYVGSSPFACPATLMLVAHVEQRGVWAIKGGIAALAKAIGEGIERLGGSIVTDAPVDEIVVSGRSVTGVRAAGQTFPSDIVIMNGDASALGKGLFGKAVSRVAHEVQPAQRSLSAVTFSAAAVSQRPLPYHTVLFGRDYPAEFQALFKERRTPDDPTVYVCSPDGATADGKPQPILIVMNAPADGDRRPLTDEEIERCHNQAMETLARCDLPLTLLRTVPTTPCDFAAMLPATGGALYGRASHGWTASFQRPAIKTKVKGLYLAGGSVHPGPGVPMAALSGWTAAQSIRADFGLTRASPQAVMPGGTLTA
ncbi:MAG: phytoene desaturase family protein [Pseudomonadota bacterium]